MSGDGNLDNTGALTIVDNAIDYDKLNQEVGKLIIVPVTSDQILNLNSDPLLIIPAAGPNTLIVIDEILCVLNYATTPYTNASIRAIYGLVTGNIASDTLSLGSGASIFSVGGGLAVLLNGRTFAQLGTINTAIYLAAQGGPITDGDSPAILYITYHIVTLS
jgi:hypothetical protein